MDSLICSCSLGYKGEKCCQFYRWLQNCDFEGFLSSMRLRFFLPIFWCRPSLSRFFLLRYPSKKIIEILCQEVSHHHSFLWMYLHYSESWSKPHITWGSVSAGNLCKRICWSFSLYVGVVILSMHVYCSTVCPLGRGFTTFTQVYIFLNGS